MSADGVISVLRIFLVSILAMTMSSCGAERALSGIWRQVACDPGSEVPTDCPNSVLELHLGRYGRDLTGLIVEYDRDTDTLASFSPIKKCDCVFVKGGYASGDTLYFGAYRTTQMEPASCGESLDPTDIDIQCESNDRQFELTQNGDLLEGFVYCGNRQESRISITFAEVTGEPRRRCPSGTANESRAGQQNANALTRAPDAGEPQ
jgi:hypothetical protein